MAESELLNLIREELRKVLSDDPEALRLAEEILEVYAREGGSGVRRYIAKLVEEVVKG